MNPASENGPKTLVVNPVSGSGDHVEEIRRKAEREGYDVVQTEGAGDGVDLAEAAADRGSPLIAAAGGDGTVNEVVRGVAAAGALDRVTVGVVPVGTGNNFAQQIGVTDVDQAFEVLERGERRRIDLGVAGRSSTDNRTQSGDGGAPNESRPTGGADDGDDGTIFVNSCISGITAEASGATTPEMKSRFGVLAYVVNTFETVHDFDGLGLSIELWHGEERDPVWTGDAMMILVGNGRRFSLQGNTQANMEDGLFDVTIVENAPTSDLLGEALVERLLGTEGEQTVRLHASSLELTGLDAEPVNFSLDGEIVESESLSLDVDEGALSVPVGDAYEPNPTYDS